jgi:hypothetical protein
MVLLSSKSYLYPSLLYSLKIAQYPAVKYRYGLGISSGFTKKPGYQCFRPPLVSIRIRIQQCISMRTESDPGFGIILEVKGYLFFPLFPHFYLLKQKTLQKSTKKLLIFANPGVQLQNVFCQCGSGSRKADSMQIQNAAGSRSGFNENRC